MIRQGVRRHVARLYARIADARATFQHHRAHTISKTHAIVVAEALAVRARAASARGTITQPGRRVERAGGGRAGRIGWWRVCARKRPDGAGLPRSVDATRLPPGW